MLKICIAIWGFPIKLEIPSSLFSISRTNWPMYPIVRLMEKFKHTREALLGSILLTSSPRFDLTLL